MTEHHLLITSGNGPEECERAAALTLSRLLKEAAKAGLEIDILEQTAGVRDGDLISCLLEVTGKNAAVFVQQWCGTVKWIFTSPYRPGHRRRNWFVGVFALPGEERLGELQDKDLEVTTKKASGPGGQHVNKTESCVRITHRPSGLFAECRSERSQHRNRKTAMLKLLALMDAAEQDRGNQRRQDIWSRHHQLERGNEVRCFRKG